jgi:hypothetical protein
MGNTINYLDKLAASTQLVCDVEEEMIRSYAINIAKLPGSIQKKAMKIIYDAFYLEAAPNPADIGKLIYHHLAAGASNTQGADFRM